MAGRSELDGIAAAREVLDGVRCCNADAAVGFTGWKSWVNLQIVNDPGKGFALVGAILAILGLLISLFTRQRRIWVKQSGKTQVAGLAKNGIPGLEQEIDELVKEMSNER